MSITKEEKKELLQELVEKFSRSKTVIFAGYRGLSVKGLSEVRRRLRGKDAEMKVGKKTLMRLAAKQNGIEGIDEKDMEGPVAATFSYQDHLAGLQILFKFSKENEHLKLLGGIIEGKPVDAATIKKYAQLPSREELLAKMLGSLKSPVSGFVGVLGNVLGGFVRVLAAYKDSLPVAAEPITEAPVTEAPAPETAAAPVTEAPAA